MGFFNKILSKLGMGDDQNVLISDAGAAELSEVETETGQVASVAISEVDVMSQLEQMASSASQKLSWKESIVDLLKLLDLDSSYGARKELAAELDCPAEKMADSAQMNMWLHKTVLQKLAENGGNIPADLL